MKIWLYEFETRQDNEIEVEKNNDSVPRNYSGSPVIQEELEGETEEDDEELLSHDMKQLLEGGRTLRNRSSLKPREKFKDFVMAVENTDPKCNKEVVEQHLWKKAMDIRIDSLTQVVVKLPKNPKAIPCKLVSKVKLKPDGVSGKRETFGEESFKRKVKLKPDGVSGKRGTFGQESLSQFQLADKANDETKAL